MVEVIEGFKQGSGRIRLGISEMPFEDLRMLSSSTGEKMALGSGWRQWRRRDVGGCEIFWEMGFQALDHMRGVTLREGSRGEPGLGRQQVWVGGSGEQ